jgi:N-acetyl-anhydromuramyl-L-alanine amidase AmpD
MIPEVPMASKFVPAHPSNYGLRIGRAGLSIYEEITIHCTDGHSYALPVAEMFAKNLKARGEPPRSSHFITDQDGSIIQCVPLRYAAYHAHTANSRSVGVEHCARTPGELGKNDPGLPPSSIMYEKSAELVAWLLAAAGLEASEKTVKGHNVADPNTKHTRCPDGCGWNWDLYRDLVYVARKKIIETPALLV